MERLRAERDAAAGGPRAPPAPPGASTRQLAELDRAGLVALALDVGSPRRGTRSADRRRLARAPARSRRRPRGHRERDLPRVRRAARHARRVAGHRGDARAGRRGPARSPPPTRGEHVPIATAAASLHEELERQEDTLAAASRTCSRSSCSATSPTSCAPGSRTRTRSPRRPRRRSPACAPAPGIGVDLQWELRPGPRRVGARGDRAAAASQTRGRCRSTTARR